MIPYDKTKIKQFFADSNNASTNAQKGKLFEDLTCYLFETIPGIRVAGRNTMNQYHTEEVDVSIWNDKMPNGLPFLHYFFLIECKNWSRPVASVDVNWFATKVESRGLDFGILVATNVITHSENEMACAHKVLSDYLKKHIQIIVIDKDDILNLDTTDDMILLIKNKICELIVLG